MFPRREVVDNNNEMAVVRCFRKDNRRGARIDVA